MLLSKGREPEKAKLSFETIFFTSFLASIVVGVAAYLLLDEYGRDMKPTVNDLILIFTIIAATVALIVGFLIALIINKGKIVNKSMRELRNFKDFTDSIHHSQTEEGVYKNMYEYIRKTVSVDVVTLFYNNHLEYEGVEKIDSFWQRLGNEKVPLCNMSPKSCPVIKTGRECRIRSIQNGITCAYQLPEYKFGSYVCLSIVNIDTPQSILQLYSKHENEFNEELISKLKSYTEITKTLIKSRRRITTLDKSSKFDNLTKVYNRGYFNEQITWCMEDAKSANENLSLIMLDIDFFKKINDNYGHFAGDHVLVLFAKLVISAVRSSDIVARYGGEEFVVVLPRTDIDTAYEVAERIRQSVEKAYMPPYGDIDIPSISCSVGVSTYPLFCSNQDDLIKTADLGLYKAKNQGRNRTIIYDKSFGMSKV